VEEEEESEPFSRRPKNFLKRSPWEKSGSPVRTPPFHLDRAFKKSFPCPLPQHQLLAAGSAALALALARAEGVAARRGRRGGGGGGGEGACEPYVSLARFQEFLPLFGALPGDCGSEIFIAVRPKKPPAKLSARARESTPAVRKKGKMWRKNRPRSSFHVLLAVCSRGEHVEEEAEEPGGLSRNEVLGRDEEESYS